MFGFLFPSSSPQAMDTSTNGHTTSDSDDKYRSTCLIPKHLSDLTLLVDNEVLLHVTASTLRAQSPFFEAMLRGPWLEAQKSGPIKLPDDDPDAFELLCRILYHDIPAKTPTAEQITELGVVCDKYGCIRAAASSMRHWVGALLKQDEDALWPDQMCFIAWMLKDRALFVKGWHKLVDRHYTSSYRLSGFKTRFHGPMAPGGTLNIRWQETSLLHKDLLPEGTERAMKQAASQRNHELHKAAQSFVEESLSLTWCIVKQAANPAQCDDNTVGGLARALRANKIEVLLSKTAIEAAKPPLHNPENSVEELVAKLAGSLSFQPGRGHDECAPQKEWKERLWSVIAKPPALTKEQEARFKKLAS